MVNYTVSYEGFIGADNYHGWCSAANPVEQPFLQVDNFKREVLIEQVETQGLLLKHGRCCWISLTWPMHPARGQNNN